MNDKLQVIENKRKFDSNKEVFMNVPLLDLKTQYKIIENEVLKAISDVLESQRCIGGPKVTELEQRIAGFAIYSFRS